MLPASTASPHPVGPGAWSRPSAAGQYPSVRPAARFAACSPRPLRAPRPARPARGGRAAAAAPRRTRPAWRPAPRGSTAASRGGRRREGRAGSPRGVGEGECRDRHHRGEADGPAAPTAGTRLFEPARSSRPGREHRPQRGVMGHGSWRAGARRRARAQAGTEGTKCQTVETVCVLQVFHWVFWTGFGFLLRTRPTLCAPITFNN